MNNTAPFIPCRWIWCCLHDRGNAAAGTLQQMAHDLAASKQGKSAQLVWNRALLHQLAAQAHVQDGEAYCTSPLCVAFINYGSETQPSLLVSHPCVLHSSNMGQETHPQLVLVFFMHQHGSGSTTPAMSVYLHSCVLHQTSVTRQGLRQVCISAFLHVPVIKHWSGSNTSKHICTLHPCVLDTTSKMLAYLHLRRADIHQTWVRRHNLRQVSLNMVNC